MTPTELADLTDDEYLDHLVAQAPPLTEEQKAVLRVLFRRPWAVKSQPAQRAA